MTIALPAKPRIVTRRIGGLSALHQADVEMVIWSRQLAPPISTELLDLAASGMKPLDFFTLAIDPADRIRQQLAKARIHSQFLIADIASLVIALGELSKARRIRVCLSTGMDDPTEKISKRAGLQLVCVYSEQGIRPSLKPASTARTGKKGSRLAARVVAFRPGQAPVREEHTEAEGLSLRLLTVLEK